MSVQATRNQKAPVRDLVIVQGCITSDGAKVRGDLHTTRNDEETFTLISTGRALDAKTENAVDRSIIESAIEEREAELAAEEEAAAAKKAAKKAPTLGDSVGKK